MGKAKEVLSWLTIHRLAPWRRRQHRRIATASLVAVLFSLAALVGVFAVLAVWTNRQAPNTDNWTATSSKVLADKKVQTALSVYLVNELFSSVDVEAALKTKLPPQLQGLSGPVASGLQQLAGQVAPRLLASSQVQNAWAAANRAAHKSLLKIINGGGNVASTNNGMVTLDVHALVAELATSLGVSQQQVAAAQQKLQGSTGTQLRNAAQQKLGVTLPPSSGQIVIMRSDQLKTVQDVAGAIKGLAIVLPVVMFALFALAVWLSIGRRRVALRTTGWCFVAIGVFTLLARRLIGNEVVDGLVQNPSNKPAVHDVWSIATSLLYDIGVAMVVFGFDFVVAAALAGSTRPAQAVRRALAPSLRERPVAVYGSVGFVYLLVIAWGPTPAFRHLIPVLAIAGLLVLGVAMLRRQTAREYPHARRADTMRAMRAWSAQPRRSRAPASSAPGRMGAASPTLSGWPGLHDRGALSDAEYEAEKVALVDGGA